MSTSTTTFNNGRYCCFTAWCDKHEIGWKPCYDEKTMDFLVYQLEEAPETKKLHYQGYVEFKKSTRIERARLALGITIGGWHAEKRIGTAFEAAEYCRKVSSRVGQTIEYGTPPDPEHVGRGHRTDLKKVADAIASGKSLRQLAVENPAEYIKYHAGIEKLLKLVQQPQPLEVKIELRPWQHQLMEIVNRGFVKRQIVWIWSRASATGKSTMQDYLIWKLGVNAVLPGTMKWADLVCAYDDHKVITFNFPRDHVLNETDYKVLEESSDGGAKLSGKYVSTTKIMRAVIVCFANIPPPDKRLPKRFIEINIDPKDSIDGVQWDD